MEFALDPSLLEDEAVKTAKTPDEFNTALVLAQRARASTTQVSPDGDELPPLSRGAPELDPSITKTRKQEGVDAQVKAANLLQSGGIGAPWAIALEEAQKNTESEQDPLASTNEFVEELLEEERARRKLNEAPREAVRQKFPVPDQVKEDILYKLPVSKIYYDAVRNKGMSREEAKQLITLNAISATGLSKQDTIKMYNFLSGQQEDGTYVTDDAIMGALLDIKDTDAKMIALEGFARSVNQNTQMFGGMYGGGRLGYQITPGHPLAKMGGAIVGMAAGGIAGTITGNATDEAILDQAFGAEPISPDHYPLYNASETGGAFVAGMPFSHMVSKMIPKNVRLSDLPVVYSVSRLIGRTPATGPTKPGVVSRMAGGVGEEARNRPGRFFSKEVTAGISAAGGASVAENLDPGGGGTRLGLETAFAVADVPRMATAATRSGVKAANRGIMLAFSDGAKQQAAADKLVGLLKSRGVDPEELLVTFRNYQRGLDADGNPLPERVMSESGVLEGPDGAPLEDVPVSMQASSDELRALEAALGNSDADYHQAHRAAMRKTMESIRLLYSFKDVAPGAGQRLKDVVGAELDMINNALTTDLVARVDKINASIQTLLKDAGADADLSEVSGQLHKQLGESMRIWRKIEGMAYENIDKSEVVNAEPLLQSLDAILKARGFSRATARTTNNPQVKNIVRLMDEMTQVRYDTPEMQYAREREATAATARDNAVKARNKAVQTWATGGDTRAYEIFSEATGLDLAKGAERLDRETLVKQTADLERFRQRVEADAVDDIRTASQRQGVMQMVDAAIDERRAMMSGRDAAAEITNLTQQLEADQYMLPLGDIINFRSQLLEAAAGAYDGQKPAASVAAWYSEMASATDEVMDLTALGGQADDFNLLWNPEFDEALSAHETSVVKLLLEGNNYQDVAETLGTNVKSVRDAASRARKKVPQAWIPMGTSNQTSQSHRRLWNLYQGGTTDVKELANGMSMSESAVRTALSRLKRRAAANRDGNPFTDQMDSKPLTANQRAILRARAISRIGNDLFSRSYAGDMMTNPVWGMGQTPPEAMLRSLTEGEPEIMLRRYNDIQRALGLRDQNGLLYNILTPELRAEVDGSVQDMQQATALMLADAIDRQVIKKRPAKVVQLAQGTGDDGPVRLRTETLPSETAEDFIYDIDLNALANLNEKYRDIINMPGMEDIKDVMHGVSGQPDEESLYRLAALVGDLKSRPDVRMTDGTLNVGDNEFNLEAVRQVLAFGDPVRAIDGFMSGKDPVSSLRGAAQLIDRAAADLPEDGAQELRDSFRAAVMHAAWRRATLKQADTGLPFVNTQNMYDDLFGSLESEQGGVTLMEILEANGLVDPTDAENVRKFLIRTAEYQRMFAPLETRADGSMQTAGWMEDAAGMFGAMLGRKYNDLSPAGATIQIPEIFANRARKLLARTPLATSRKILIEALTPGSAGNKLFRELMRKGIDGADAPSLMQEIISTVMGRNPVSMVIPAAREVAEDFRRRTAYSDAQLKEDANLRGMLPSEQEETARAAAQPQPAPAPAQTAPAPQLPPSMPPQQPQPTSTSQSTSISQQRYRQAFPNDPMADLIAPAPAAPQEPPRQ